MNRILCVCLSNAAYPECRCCRRSRTCSSSPSIGPPASGAGWCASVYVNTFLKHTHTKRYGLLIFKENQGKPGEPMRHGTRPHPRENVFHQTRPSSFIAPWSSSGAHVSIVGFLGVVQESAWSLWCSAATKLHLQQSVMLFVIWLFLIRHHSLFFALSNLCYSSSSVGPQFYKFIFYTCIRQ